MRIAIFSDNFYPELSGISDSLIVLARALAERGHQINFFVPKYSEKNYRLVNLHKNPELDLGPNIKITRLSSLPFKSGTQQSRMVIPNFWHWRKVKKFNPDIIYTNLFFGVGLEALIAAKLLKVPMIGTNHTVISEFVRYSPLKIKSLENWAWGYVNWYYNHCQIVTAPGKSLLLEMEKHGLKSDHLVIPNPLDEKVFTTLKNKTKLKTKFGFSNNTLIYAGRLAPEKNIEVLIKALPLISKKISDICLAIAGQGSSQKQLEKLIQKLKLNKKVIFLGMLDKPTLVQAYNAAETFAIASTSEVQSMTILQAMACGLPIIGVNSRGVADCIKDNGFLFAPNNHNELAEKTIELLSNKKLQTEFSQKSLTGSQEFSSAKIAQKWETVYNRIKINKSK